MLVERLKEACDNLDWKFNYGGGHWQNLLDLPDDVDKPFNEKQIYFLLLWKDRDLILNGFGGIQGATYEAEVILCVRSRISDKDYNLKYEENIKGLERMSESLLSDFSVCEEWTVKKWKEIEVENEFDTNLDGLKVRFTVELNHL